MHRNTKTRPLSPFLSFPFRCRSRSGPAPHRPAPPRCPARAGPAAPRLRTSPPLCATLGAPPRSAQGVLSPPAPHAAAAAHSRARPVLAVAHEGSRRPTASPPPDFRQWRLQKPGRSSRPDYAASARTPSAQETRSSPTLSPGWRGSSGGEECPSPSASPAAATRNRAEPMLAPPPPATRAAAPHVTHPALRRR